MPRSLYWICAGAVVAAIAATVHFQSRAEDHQRSSTRRSVRFVDVTAASGLDFRHHSGAFGKKYLPETVGSGVAFLDYNNDGWLDLLYIDSTNWPERPAADGGTRPALYRNEGNGVFTDVTVEAGLDFDQYGMGVATGDYDNDGDTDLYFTAIGPNRLFENQGDGTFVDLTSRAGVVGNPVQPVGIEWKWSSSAAWLDYDRDGLLDLWVLNYIKWTPELDVWCGLPDKKNYCPPTAYEGVPCTVYHNLGGGKFQDVTEELGVDLSGGNSFGLAVADYNEDGWPDVAVANDGQPDFLFINENGQRFREVGVAAGIAVADDGQAKAGMGIDCADWRNEGRMGLIVGNFTREGLSLYRNLGEARFREESHSAGLGDTSQLFLTFGAFFFDFDNDGWQDVFCANGHIDDFANEGDSELSYEMRPLVYRNLQDGTFEEVGQQTCPADPRRLVARGAAHGDYDNDGDPDIALLWNNRKGLLWRNEGGNENNWLGLVLRGVESNRDGIGAVVKVTANRVTQTVVRKSGGSFLSESQPRLLFGLKNARQADVEVHWPSGTVTHFSGVPAGDYYLAEEGATEPVANAVPASVAPS